MTPALTPSLRERKKLKAKAHIQRLALELFKRQGYEATTVEQIAAAAEVSPSTFFRYFPTKEAVVLYDGLDSRVWQLFQDQPSNLGVVGALRNAMKEISGTLSPDQLAIEMERGKLIHSISKVRGLMFDELVRNMEMLTAMIASRTGRSATDPAVRNQAGAIAGVIMVAVLDAYKVPKENYAKAIDDALAQLEKDFRW